jgi:hypothetical protein
MLRALMDRLRRRSTTRAFPPNEWSIEETERQLVAESVEWVYIFGPDGRQRGRFRSTSDQEVTIDLPSDALLDATLVHNHLPRRHRPTGDLAEPPSVVDLLMMARNNVMALRLVAGESRYTVERVGQAWIDEAILREEISDADGSAEAFVEAEILEGKLDPARREHRALEERLRILDEVGWLRYRKEARPHGPHQRRH